MRSWSQPSSTAAVVAMTLLLTATAADAMPGFARKYRISCASCHQMSFPKLNQYGRMFKENGYQLAKGAEEPANARAMIEPGTLSEQLSIFESVPLSVRAREVAFIPRNADAQGVDEFNFRFPADVFVFGGGSIHRNVSLLFSYSFAPAADLHYAHLGFHNLFEGALGHRTLNVRAGKFLLVDFMRPEHRHLTQIGHLISQVRVGDNPFILDSHQAGLDVYGRPNGGPLFYEVGLVEGAMDHAKGSDLDRLKDPFFRLTYTHRLASSWSLMGYLGKARITKTDQGVTRRFEDRFRLLGLDFDLPVGPTVLFGHVLRGRHDNPSGDGIAIEYWGYHAELDWSIDRQWLGIARYDLVTSDDDESLEREVLTSHLSYLLLTNLRLSAEYNSDLKDSAGSRLYLMADAAF